MLSEPAIQVRRRCRGKQIWSLEKMENRLVDMRELYQEWQDYHAHHQDNPVRRRHIFFPGAHGLYLEGGSCCHVRALLR